MIFKALDLEKDISSQGFTENSYDLVIGSLVFHATKNLRQTMTNVRKLLKPGGFLVMLELLGDGPIRMAFSMSGLPGWWLGGEDGRSLSPCIGPLQWHSLLRETGFSGADTITPMTDVLPRPLFVIASQALDDRIDLLRRPLMTSVALPTEELVILGGTTVQAVQLADSIGELMKPRFIQVVRIDTLENLALHALRSTSAVISITELDDNVFKNMTSEKFSGLKRLFDQTKLILWVTQGCRELDPYSNVTVGLGRTLAWEMPQVRIQFLDVDPSEKPNATLIAETFLRLHTLDSQHKKEPSEPFLWSIEPEIAQENGRLLIPRLRPKTASNNRYNSSRRAITKNVDLQQSTVNISYTTTSLVLEEATNPTPQDQEKINGRVFIRVSHSVLSPIRVSPNSMLFLLFGSNVHTGEKVVALSDKQASMVDVPKDWVSKHEIPASHVDSSLFLVAAELLAQYLVSLRADSRTMMVHEPDPALAAALTQLAAVKNVSILFSSTSLDHVGSHWLSVHPFASERAIKSRIPEDVSVFVDTSMGPVEDSVSKRILAYLPHDCNCIKASEIWGQTSTASKDSTFRDSLIQACERSNNRLQNLDSPLSMESVALRDVRDVSPVQRRSTVVDWAPTATIPVAIEPVDSKLMFSSDKTYILFGLTSDLGQSLCQWIVRHGARFVVLTSRAPKVQESWMKDLQVMGATIKVYAK